MFGWTFTGIGAIRGATNFPKSGVTLTWNDFPANSERSFASQPLVRRGTMLTAAVAAV
jgi:hypothetical protein